MSSIEGLAFVATGYLENFGHYDYYTNAHDLSDLKKYIEARGGFLRSAVSSKTDYLICNDQSEKTTKLKKALELGIPIITEQEFLQMAKESKIIERLPQTFEIKNGFLKKYNGNDSKVEIPDGVTTICKYAFCSGSFNHSLTTLSVPESVKKIGPRALASCRELKKLSVFCGDFEIENNAFYQTNHIEKIELNSDEKIALKAFKKLISFSELKIPLLLYALRQKDGSLLRAECSSQCVTYKDRLMAEIIKRNDSELLNNLFSCFKRKIALDKINSYIEAVKNSPELLSILLTYKDAKYSVEEESKAEETKIELELGLRKRTLSQWRKIFSISIFEDGYQISKCKVDQPVVIIPGEIAGKPVRAIACGAFSQSRTIEQIQIPDGVKIIGEEAFLGCQNLKRVVLPEELTSIGESAFEGCYKADFKLPKSIASIGCRAFRGCANLSSVTIPDGTTTIGDSEFEGCACLASVTIPDSVTEIGSLAFRGCESFTIHAPAGSYAETYAQKHNIPFVAE